METLTGILGLIGFFIVLAIIGWLYEYCKDNDIKILPYFIGLIILLIFIVYTNNGCKDPNAINYNPNAWFENNHKCVNEVEVTKTMKMIFESFKDTEDNYCTQFDEPSICEIDERCEWIQLEEYLGYCTTE